MNKKFELKTSRHSEMIDITYDINELLTSSAIEEGIVTVYCPHTTAGITINEGADPDVVNDILMKLDELYPWNDIKYNHTEGNSAAHIKSSLMGASQVIPVINGRMILGTWQSIYFCEFDGPRNRVYYIKLIKDSY